MIRGQCPVENMVCKRMSQVKASSTLKQAELVKKMRAKGVDVVSFTVGEPDFDTPENVVSAAKEALDQGETHYVSSQGILEVREAVAEKLVKDNKVICTHRDVLISPTKHLLFMSLMALVEKGDEVIIPSPAWISYPEQVRLAEAKPVFANMDPEKGFALDINEIRKTVTTRTKALVLCNPSNPTGRVEVRKDLEKLADLAKEKDFIIISDEVYEKLIYEGDHISMASLKDMKERTVTIGGLSKSHAMTGWRAGWCSAPEEILQAMLKVQQHSVTCTPPFVQKAMVEALKGDQSERKRMLEEFRKRRDLMVELVEECDELDLPTVPQGAFYLFPRFNKDATSWDLAERILKTGHVGVTPGDAFGTGGRGHLRLSYATSQENIRTGMKRMSDVLNKV